MADYVVITDTSCLILLDKIKAFDLLHDIYAHILTTPEIANKFKKVLPAWIEVTPVKNISLIAIYNQQVDLGEASAIALPLKHRMRCSLWTTLKAAAWRNSLICRSPVP